MGVAENRYEDQQLNFYTLHSTVVSDFQIELCILRISNAAIAAAVALAPAIVVTIGTLYIRADRSGIINFTSMTHPIDRDYFQLCINLIQHPIISNPQLIKSS